MIMGIDPALKTSGIAIFNEEGHLLYANSFSTNPKEKLSMRLDSILVHIEALVNKYGVDSIIFEDVQEQHKNVVTYRRLVSVSTIIEYWCDFSQIKWKRVSASHWRKICSHSFNENFGRTRKEQKKKAQEIVKRFFQYEVDEDTSEAILIAYSAIISGEFEDKYKESAF